jgi:hypothetical protein
MVTPETQSVGLYDVCVRERGGWGREGYGLRNDISVVILDILTYISLAELATLCPVGLRDPMNLCTSVSEEGGDGEDTDSETPSLFSYTLQVDTSVSRS